MTEAINTKEHYYTKDFKGYKNTEDNFVANQELTVTITLNEYRNLISEAAKAKSKIDEAEKDKWTRESENSKLKEENSKLKFLLYEKTISKEDEEEGKEDE